MKGTFTLALALAATAAGAELDLPPGVLAFHEKTQGQHDIFLSRDSGASASRLTSHPADDMSPAISPDGARVAFQSNRAGRPHLFVVPAVGGSPAQLTTGTSIDQSPCWSPGGETIYFDSHRGDGFRLCAVSSAGGPVRVLTGAGSDCLSPACSPDGKRLACQMRRAGSPSWTVGVVDLEGNLLWETAMAGSEFNETPSFSEDGRWVYFAASSPSGYRLCRVAADGKGRPEPIGDWPGWKLHPTAAGSVLLYDERAPAGWRLGVLDLATNRRRTLPSAGERFGPSFRPLVR